MYDYYGDLISLLSISGTTFIIIFLAEFGDKSQLVCMSLSARYRALPVLFGAISAFSLLNLLAVLLGGAIASWISPFWIAILAGCMFFAFGLHALFFSDEDGEEGLEHKSIRNLFVTALTMIFLAELGDKTQIAVAGMASAYETVSVWIGATLALSATTLVGVVAGKTLLKKVPLHLIHQISGILFVGLGIFAFYQAFGHQTLVL
ncbi:TMEM165/GDT1 family protein [Pseudoalteromonas sp.]|uniref:TMEM165/GDT1 family protein n=1 Tax=Pseudoalteromonas sp. TaxID=53249 RepID=UPI00260FBDB9|nr:TMEM165/GDT1 family protein [Pseudoalteromonas sp.]MCP4586897.1 TMEM165/GDT1 family protein [Pseudoalteromonas sp.]